MNAPPPASTRACRICGSERFTEVFALESTGRVLQCLGCGIQFAETYPDIEELDETTYSEEYFRQAIRDSEQRMGVFHELLEQVEALLPGDRKPGSGREAGPPRLLDVGAGEGTLLRAARERGWWAEGTEIASDATDFARESFGLTVHPGVLEDLDLPEAAFDAVVMNHVLEHTRDPRQTLEVVRDLLAGGGVLRVEVPNISSLSSRLKNLQSRLSLKSNPWKHYATHHHFWYFTPATLARTMGAAGLELLSLESRQHQWDDPSALQRLHDRVSRGLGTGKHLVAFARKEA